MKGVTRTDPDGKGNPRLHLSKLDFEFPIDARRSGEEGIHRPGQPLRKPGRARHEQGRCPAAHELGIEDEKGKPPK